MKAALKTSPRKHEPLSETTAIGADPIACRIAVRPEDLGHATVDAQVVHTEDPLGFGDGELQAFQGIVGHAPWWSR
ncbi:hypothetical protein [Nocardia iowensis]|uniref:Uncharacterized protein n=1 Tax=Nocardia iowensis TaxID=204891 RepID=A0ABX8RGM1_NOCIO|nr:hypothetical protein [Nocardia iowensis]QXN88748.1 hypothetical protein KV110_24520 [Nocardia iowensis]